MIGHLPDLFGKTHPAVAHFPIGLLLLALVAETIGRVRKDPKYHFAGKFCLVFGALGALVTSGSGFPLTTLVYNSYIPPVLTWHKFLGLGATLIALLAGFMAFRGGAKMSGKSGFIYFILLVLIAVLILATCHTGGMLVYGEDYFSLK
jgi:uncharacterized membrane protein